MQPSDQVDTYKKHCIVLTQLQVKGKKQRKKKAIHHIPIPHLYLRLAMVLDTDTAIKNVLETQWASGSSILHQGNTIPLYETIL